MLTFDFSAFERAAAGMQAAADQIPFALARSLNDATAAARQELISGAWPSHMTVRNKGFLGAALRREFASKGSLRASIVESGPAAGRGNLTLHEDGGARRARGATLAIPNASLKAKRTGRGMPKGLRPSALPNSFRRGDSIYQRTGTYQKGPGRGAHGRGLKLMYTLKPSVAIRPEVPFHADFERVMTRVVWRAFAPRLEAAMASRRRR